MKVVDRICNLREGARSFTDGRWKRYVAQTRAHIFPLIQGAAEPQTHTRLMNLLEEAIALRPVI